MKFLELKKILLENHIENLRKIILKTLYFHSLKILLSKIRYIIEKKNQIINRYNRYEIQTSQFKWKDCSSKQSKPYGSIFCWKILKNWLYKQIIYVIFMGHALMLIKEDPS